MILFLLWWCFDDHLAAAVGAPGLGELPWWVVLLIGVVLDGLATARAGGER
ncbi:hypothetical protein IWC96_14510 [Brevundimonas sp. BAL450]|uniref:hypothetical protein n=1 Tax=Brevundimonas sp. BAL450 TaxID=1708162 RepID=UPI0018CBB57F|nr:hypothetical protein [Brevundimonas sp. BAL450]MBG7616487.1 hypothetical protein [Brevundimonas sp. BAL450]